MRDRSSGFLALQGWTILAGMFVIVWLLLAPQVTKLKAGTDLQQDLVFKIDRYQDKLNQPLPPDANTKYGGFVHPLPLGQTLDQFEPDLQARLLNTVRSNQARLVGLTALPSTGDQIGSLGSLEYRLEIEGHYIATTAVLRALSGYEEPLLIDRITIQPANRNGRPDSNLRSQMNIRLLIEAPQ